MVEPSDVHAALEARRELGPAYEDQIVDSMVEKIEKRLAQRAPRRAGFDPRELGIAVPIVAVAGIFGGPAGVFFALGALVVVFLVRTFHGR